MQLGTLTSDIAGQLKELRQGRIEFKMESKSILHAGVGKVILCFLQLVIHFLIKVTSVLGEIFSCAYLP